MTRKREVMAAEDIADLPPPTWRHPMRAALASAPEAGEADQPGIDTLRRVGAAHDARSAAPRASGVLAYRRRRPRLARLLALLTPTEGA
jgi:hypothetical protein